MKCTQLNARRRTAYALVYGITKNAVDSTVALNLLGGAGGLFVGVVAMLNMNALGAAVFSR